MKQPITIVDYNPQWPRLYEAERDQISNVISDVVVAIEHIGSTSVPGLGAKPILDIMLAVHRLTDAAVCIQLLQALGYEYVPEHEVFIPERRFFRKDNLGVRTHHIHLVELTSNFWARHLLFRDFLRAHPGVAHQYCRLKQELATKFGSDLSAYTDAKTTFIESIVARARRADKETKEQV